MTSICSPVRSAWARARATDRCLELFSGRSDPAERSSLGLKVAMVAIHLILVSALFAFDSGLIYKTRKEPWYTAVYLALVVAALFQYFFTSATSPGYVLDAMRFGVETHATYSKTSSSKQSASSKHGGLLPTLDSHPVTSSSSWMKLVKDMHPPGSSSRSWTCTYCNVLQPPRSKHCHDCDKCVLGFDHHCVWFGTCIGQGNHCRFWWFIFEETILSTWTCVLYITFLKRNSSDYWWKGVIMILFLGVLFICLIFLLLLLIFHSYLVLTNQTTYELARRRRISYLRVVPARVNPFSKGICRNIYNFCCARRSIYAVESLPSTEELQARARPYTCMDILSCRCC